MTERRDLYPGYDVLAKRDGPSWNPQTRRVVDARLAIGTEERSALDDGAWAVLVALCRRIVPQPPDRAAPVPLAAMVDRKIAAGASDGYRHADMLPHAEAWRRGLAAIDEEARAAHGAGFADLDAARQDALLKRIQSGEATHAAWAGMKPAAFFKTRVLRDVVGSYYAHPTAWSEIGFGGPASPRGYVRMDFDRRDPWEAAEAAPGLEAEARRENRRVR